MNHHTATILAITPGTRYLGFAVMQGHQLIDWGISVIPAGTPQVKLHRTRSRIARFLEDYSPDLLVLKQLNPALSPELLMRQHREIQALAREHHISLRLFSLRAMKTHLAPDTPINKRHLAKLITQQHPVLIHELRKEQDALNPYHLRMFEAVALGELASVQSIPTRKNELN